MSDLANLLPATICEPCPVEPERPSLLPTITNQVIVIDCLKAALQAMTTQMYCDLDNGPKGCGK